MFSLLKHDIERYIGRSATSAPVWAAWAVIRYPGLFAVAVYRFGYWINANFGTHERRFFRYFLKVFFYFLHRLSIYRAKIEITEATEIGPGLYLANEGGIIIGARKIGARFTVGPRVTIGMNVRNHLNPVIGERVTIGCDTLVYGDIAIGDGVLIDASTVLTKSVPEKVWVKGNPARIVRRNVDDVAPILPSRSNEFDNVQ